MPLDYFEGTITSKATVTDTFADAETVEITVKRVGDAAACNDAQVSVTSATDVFIPGDPAIRKQPADLDVGQTVRVRPPFPVTDECPMHINATRVEIVKLNDLAS